MKLAILIILALLFQNSTLAQESRLRPFRLSGIIKGRDSGYVYLNYIPDGKMGVLDSCRLRHGHFVFNGNVSEPTKVWFYMPDANGIINEKNLTQFYIESANMELSAIASQFEALHLTGSASDSDRIRVENLEKPIRTIIESAKDSFAKYNNQYKNEKKNKSDIFKLNALMQKKESIRKFLEHLYRNKALIDSEFIIKNSNSYVAADMLARSSFEWIAFPSLDSLYQRFPNYIQQSFPGKKIKYEIEQDRQVPLRSCAKNFKAIDSKGDTISLASYKDKKYVLLDFGASWCAPCRRIIPQLKHEYAKYDTILEIISIANQDQEDQWRKAIEDDKMSWPQIIENKKTMPIEPAGMTISDTYYIDTTPSLILIDKNSQIIGKYGGFYYSGTDYLSDLDAQLNEVFRK